VIIERKLVSNRLKQRIANRNEQGVVLGVVGRGVHCTGNWYAAVLPQKCWHSHNISRHSKDTEPAERSDEQLKIKARLSVVTLTAAPPLMF